MVFVTVRAVACVDLRGLRLLEPATCPGRAEPSDEIP
jgi:hypothetical protein